MILYFLAEATPFQVILQNVLGKCFDISMHCKILDYLFKLFEFMNHVIFALILALLLSKMCRHALFAEIGFSRETLFFVLNSSENIRIHDPTLF